MYWRHAQEVEFLLCKLEALSSNPVPPKMKNKKKLTPLRGVKVLTEHKSQIQTDYREQIIHSLFDTPRYM
jgi:hypothetical protein